MEFLFHLFPDQPAPCQKQSSGVGDWICPKCGGKWRDSIHGEGWLPFACPEYDKRAETRESATSEPATAL
jgi:hypothetical protein